MKTLADRINNRMKELNITQEELANEIGISQAAVQKITSGKTEHPKKILEISKKLRVSPDWLTTGIGDIEKASLSPLEISIQDENGVLNSLKLSMIDSITALDMPKARVLKNFLDLLLKTPNNNHLNHA